MAMSVNTNIGAMAALQSLNDTNKSLSTVQNRNNTGLNVSSTKDDSAKFTIAQKLRGDLGGLSAVTSSLSRAKSTVDVAVAGAEQVSDLLNQMKTKATEASDAGLDTDSRKAITADLNALRKQVNSIIEASDFNGTNLLKTEDPAAAEKTKVSALMSNTSSTTLDVKSADLEAVFNTALGGDSSTDLTLADATAAGDLKDDLDVAFSKVSEQLSTLGSASRQIDGQMTFVSKLSDSIEGGIGNLVDADLAKESAKLQALQVKQQLGVQALSIANQAPQSIMSLFR